MNSIWIIEKSWYDGTEWMPDLKFKRSYFTDAQKANAFWKEIREKVLKCDFYDFGSTLSGEGVYYKLYEGVLNEKFDL